MPIIERLSKSINNRMLNWPGNEHQETSLGSSNQASFGIIKVALAKISGASTT